METIPKECRKGAATMNEKRTRAQGGRTSGLKANLASLVSYQEGSVVSRTLVDDEAGTVTLFAFDEGDGLSEHTGPYDALLYLSGGCGRRHHR